jgi:hypothetical protein
MEMSEGEPEIVLEVIDQRVALRRDHDEQGDEEHAGYLHQSTQTFNPHDQRRA